MSYIGDMRKFVGHAPIMAVAAMGSYLKKEQTRASGVHPAAQLSLEKVLMKP